MSEVTETETGSRIAMPWPPYLKWIRRHNYVADSLIWMKFGRQMKNDVYTEAVGRAR